MPNVPSWQDLARLYFDQYYLELLDEGKQVEEPYIYTVAKGKSKLNSPTDFSINFFYRNPSTESAPRTRAGGVVLTPAL
jgi:hypothetical protein